ncbi:MAG TPA: chromate resistance protein ChrB domain-containing protein [Aggregatilineales bacterium]|nr:chromate resistance protein ChrB domain-containing protein [Aggregatilineales bacterium]
MKWVTWEDVGVDRMACAWLIRKVVDTSAEFVFIPVGAPLPAEAEPFDIPGARLSHHRGLCSFQVLLDEYKLDDPILKRIGRIVQEADVVQEATVEVAAPGLDLICRGIRRTSPDDQAALEHGILIYDALYAQLQFESQGSK